MYPFITLDIKDVDADTMEMKETMRECMDLMARVTELGIMSKYPYTREGFEKEYGLDIAELEKQAREFDEKEKGGNDGKADDGSAGAKTGRGKRLPMCRTTIPSMLGRSIDIDDSLKRKSESTNLGKSSL